MHTYVRTCLDIGAYSAYVCVHMQGARKLYDVSAKAASEYYAGSTASPTGFSRAPCDGQKAVPEFVLAI